jgi:hypothetical protein
MDALPNEGVPDALWSSEAQSALPAVLPFACTEMVYVAIGSPNLGRQYHGGIRVNIIECLQVSSPRTSLGRDHLANL